MAFNNKPVTQRMAIVSAGPIANFILAIVVYWFVFLQGTSSLAPVIFSVEENSIASKAMLPTGVEIVEIDGHPVSSANQVVMQLLERLGDSGAIAIKTVTPGSDNTTTYQLLIDRWLSEAGDDVQPLDSLGVGFYRPDIEPVIEAIMDDSAAQKAGLKPGDRLLKMDDLAIEHWDDWASYVRARADVTIALEYLRDGDVMNTTITPQLHSQRGESIGMVGVQVKLPELPEYLISHQQYNVITAWLPALTRTWDTAVFSLTALKKMITGDISYKQLSGPISIAKIATDSARSGIYNYLSLLALLSISLGVLNLLPIPVLDGGHLLFYLIEWVKGSPVPEKVQMLSFQLGMAVVMAVMVLAIVNDIGRL